MPCGAFYSSPFVRRFGPSVIRISSNCCGNPQKVWTGPVSLEWMLQTDSFKSTTFIGRYNYDITSYISIWKTEKKIATNHVHFGNGVKTGNGDIHSDVERVACIQIKSSHLSICDSKCANIANIWRFPRILRIHWSSSDPFRHMSPIWRCFDILSVLFPPCFRLPSPPLWVYDDHLSEDSSTRIFLCDSAKAYWLYSLSLDGWSQDSNWFLSEILWNSNGPRQRLVSGFSGILKRFFGEKAKKLLILFLGFL